MKSNYLLLVAFIAGIVLFVWSLSWILPTMLTNSRLEAASILAKQQEVADGYVFNDIIDWWGKPIIIKCGPSEDGTAFVYMAISSGKDKIMGSSDDLSKTQIDLNKSKMAGKYAAKKLKEFVKGFKEGEKESSKFDGK